MSDKVFVDTNILIYAHDVDAGRKHDVAAERVRELWISRDGVVSIQVLQELYVNVTRKIPKPLSRKVARELVGTYAAWTVQRVGASDVVRASEIEERHKLSFWDALIVVAAHKAAATTLLSEDLSHGQRIEGVRVENPFRGA
jgi:predicted nucleic acid-binding protein